MFATDREKLERISEVVNRLFGIVPPVTLYESLMLIDSICDEPLEGE